jgi:hypothetical protein
LLRVLGRSELLERPCRVVRVRIPDLDERGLALLRAFGAVEAVPGGAVVRGEALEVPRIAEAVVKAGYPLHGLVREDDGLEQLFLELVRGAS